MKCPKCGSENYIRKGKTENGTQRYKCKNCKSRFVANTADKPEKESWTEDKKTATGTIITAVKPRTLKDAVELFQVDVSIWEAERMIINSWDVTMKIGKGDSAHPLSETNYQVKVWFKKRVQEITPEELAEQFKKHLAEYSPIAIQKNKPFETTDELLLEITNFDLHLGKLCWNGETGENFDIKIARERFRDGVSDLLNKAFPFGFSKILFAVGNDFFQADNPENTTSAGTTVETDVRWQKRFSVGNKLLVDGIDMLRQYSEVDVICIPGNHDWTTMFMAGEYLRAWYKNDELISINNDPKSRKYYSWKDVLIGYTHGHKEKPIDLFSLMANEASSNWHSAKTKEWHLGHFHHEMTKDYNGVVVRWLKSQTGTDSWHYGKGFIGSKKGSQAFLYQPKQGMIANFYSNIGG